MANPAMRGAEAGMAEGMSAFGAYALSPTREALRRFGQQLGRSGVARRICSLIRRVVSVGHSGPFDVEAFPGQSARLYPDENLTDKRVFAGVQFWDWTERAALGSAIRAAQEPVYVIDAGANAGLYTLAIRAEAQGKALRVLAIEPDPQNYSRLVFNIAASGANDEVSAVPVALSDQSGTAYLGGGDENRGEIALQDAGTAVPMRPLIDLVLEAGFPRVDALKIDIEGMEEQVLTHYLHSAPASLLPRLVVLEARRGEQTPALTRLQGYGYEIVERTKMNVILRHDAGVKG